MKLIYYIIFLFSLKNYLK